MRKRLDRSRSTSNSWCSRSNSRIAGRGTRPVVAKDAQRVNDPVLDER
jgi:hypothetical protein